MDEILAVLPERLRGSLLSLARTTIENVEEIRLRIERPVEIVVSGKPLFPRENGKTLVMTHSDASHLLNKISQFSLYALDDELQQGFITIRGGHRIGICGKVITEKGAVKRIRDISSFNIRVARQKIGAADRLTSYLYEAGWKSTLIIGAPQTGKTTLLRDIARKIASGDRKKGLSPQKVGIVDERSEIAGSLKGVPRHDLGLRVDVLDRCPKAEGMMMMIRSMSPDVLVVDEIGRKEDIEAIFEAIHAGVALIATVHASALSSVIKRPMIRPLLAEKVFDRYVELQRAEMPGVIHRIFDGKQRLLYPATARMIPR